MDAGTITNIIGSLGFPIAAACFMAWFMVTQVKEFRKTIEENTKVIQELLVTIRERREKDQKEVI